MRNYKEKFEREFNLEIAPAALQEMIRLAKDYLKDEYFPAKAVDHFRNICKEVSGEFNSLNG